jgi:hypothetical protein
MLREEVDSRSTVLTGRPRKGVPPVTIQKEKRVVRDNYQYGRDTLQVQPANMNEGCADTTEMGKFNSFRRDISIENLCKMSTDYTI